MKTYLIPTVLALIILAGCSSTKEASDYDDVYYSARKEKKQKKAEEMQTSDPDYYVQNESNTAEYKMEEYDAGDYVAYEDDPVYSETQTIENPDGTTYITNNYYGAGGYGDYYDYSYSARINRFYNPYVGFNYYSPCYVGFYYDPWYNPYWYRPSLYFGFNWGWGGYGWGYPYYGYPYPYYSYNSYWHGYNHGYWDGYYAGGYYPDYGNSSYYYGPRGSRGSSNSATAYSGSGSSYAQGSTPTYSDRNRPLLSSGVVSRPATSTSVAGSRGDNFNVVSDPRGGQDVKQTVVRPTGSGVSATDRNNVPKTAAGAATVAGTSAAMKADRQDQKTDARPSAQEAKPRYSYKKPATKPATVNSSYKPGEVIDSRTGTQPVQKYSKPGNYNTEQNVAKSRNANTNQRSTLYTKPKTSSSESYSRPSQPATRYAQPSRSATRSYSQPSRANTKSYSQPSRSSSSYSRPANTGSTRSSYSRPSSSGSSRSSSGTRSYSAPSRSSSGGSGTRSSSSSGSRGKR